MDRPVACGGICTLRPFTKNIPRGIDHRINGGNGDPFPPGPNISTVSFFSENKFSCGRFGHLSSASCVCRHRHRSAFGVVCKGSAANTAFDDRLFPVSCAHDLASFGDFCVQGTVHDITSGQLQPDLGRPYFIHIISNRNNETATT